MSNVKSMEPSWIQRGEAMSIPHILKRAQSAFYVGMLMGRVYKVFLFLVFIWPKTVSYQ